MKWLKTLICKEKAPEVFEKFDYMVIEKMKPTGVTYFTGQSCPKGDVQMLAECEYHRRSHYARSPVSRFGDPCTYGMPVYKPVYVLISVKQNERYSTVGGAKYKYAEFKDPCAVRDIICGLIKEEAKKAERAAHCKVVSKGSCKC